MGSFLGGSFRERSKEWEYMKKSEDFGNITDL